MMNTSSILSFGAFIGAAAIVTTVLVHGGSPEGADAARTQPTVSELSIAIPEFRGPSDPEDRLPSFMSTGEGAATELILESSRLIGNSDGGRHWVVESDAGEACLVIVLSGSPETASMSCGSEQDLFQNGVALQVANDEQRVRTYLVPEGFNMDVPGLELLGDRLLVGDASLPAPEITLQQESDSSAPKDVAARMQSFSQELTLPAMETMELMP